MSHDGIPACPTCGERLSGLRLLFKQMRSLTMEESDDKKLKVVNEFRSEHILSNCCMPHLTQCVDLNEVLIRTT